MGGIKCVLTISHEQAYVDCEGPLHGQGGFPARSCGACIIQDTIGMKSPKGPSKEYEGRGEFGCWIQCVSVKNDGSLYCVNIEAAVWSCVIGDGSFC